MIISNQDLLARLSHPRNSEKARVDRKKKTLDRNDIKIGENLYLRDAVPGRREGDKNIDEDIKIPAMVLARLGVSDSDVAGTFGMSPDTAHKIKKGKGISEEGKAIAEKAIENIVGKVTTRLDQTIDNLTEAKIMNCSAPQMAHIARSLAGIIGDLNPRDANKNVNQVQVVIHGVGQKDVTHYEEVIVGS